MNLRAQHQVLGFEKQKSLSAPPTALGVYRSVGEAEIDELPFDGKTVVLCIGNRYMKDDGVGCEVAHRLRSMPLGMGVVLVESQFLDFPLAWRLRYASRLIVVDALVSGGPPGTVSRFSLLPQKGNAPLLAGLHDLDLATVLDITGIGGPPTSVTAVGVEPRECTPGEGLSAEVKAAVSKAVEAVLAELGRQAGKSPTSAVSFPKEI